MKIHKIIPSAFKGTKQKEYDNKRKRLYLSFNNIDLNTVKKASLKFKKKPALFVKEMILSQIHQKRFLSSNIEEKLSEACIQIRKIGGNVNQLAKIANETKSIDNDDFKSLSNILKVLEKYIFTTVIKP